MRLEGRLKGWDQLLKLVEGQAGEIQELRRARLHIGKLYTGHAWCLLLWEAQYTINRDNLNHAALSPYTLPAHTQRAAALSSGGHGAYEHLHNVARVSLDLLATRYEPRLAQWYQGLQA